MAGQDYCAECDEAEEDQAENAIDQSEEGGANAVGRGSERSPRATLHVISSAIPSDLRR
jgi:hypothetical protein